MRPSSELSFLETYSVLFIGSFGNGFPVSSRKKDFVGFFSDTSVSDTASLD